MFNLRLFNKDKVTRINMPCKENYKQVVIIRSLLYQNIIPKKFLVYASSRIGYWYKLLRLVHVYASILEANNYSHKLKYSDTWAKHVGSWYTIQVH